MTFPLPGANWTYPHSLRLVATAGPAGFALQNATPAILTWTAPNDGQVHRVLVFAEVNVSVAETGGLVQAHMTDAGGTAGTLQLDAGGHGTGFFVSATRTLLVQPGSTLTISQDSALTVGAAAFFAELWAL
jgi:hypothetical protein